MWNIRWLTIEEKKEWKRYLWSFKTQLHINRLRAHIRFMFEEKPDQYYLVNDEVVMADEETSSIKNVDKDIFDFVGYGTYIWSTKENGDPDKDLLKFYKENRDKIPHYHQAIFETLTAPRHRPSQ